MARQIRNYPLIVDTSLTWLGEYLKPTMRVFEWGSGGSTVYFVAYGVAEFVSIEHSEVWRSHVLAALKTRDLNSYELKLILPNELPLKQQLEKTVVAIRAMVPGSYVSRHYPQHSFKSYVEVIDGYPDGYFNLVFVDGRARPSCIQHAIPKICPGGYLMLDNSARPVYKRAVALMRRWDNIAFHGPGPPQYKPRNKWTTTVWTKPD